MKTVQFDLPYYRNGQVLFAAGVPVPADDFTAQLLADGVQGTEADITPDEAAQLADQATAAAEEAVRKAVALNALADAAEGVSPAAVQTPAA